MCPCFFKHETLPQNPPNSVMRQLDYGLDFACYIWQIANLAKEKEEINSDCSLCT